VSRTCARLLLAALLPIAAHASVTVIDFENLPDLYFFSAGGQNIGTYYPGLDFESNVTGLSVSRFGGYSDAAYPPHSGDVAIWDPVDPIMTITIAVPVESAGFWYTSYDPLTLEAFDSSNNLLGTAVGAPNTDGTTGTSSFLFLAGGGIQSISIQGTPGLYVLDDVTYGDITVPEPAFVSLAAAGVALICCLKRRA